MDTLRLLTIDDIGPYISLRREMLDDSPWSFSASPEDDRGLDPASVEAVVSTPGSCLVGAFDEGRLVAVAGVRREPKLKRRHSVLVWGVYTTPHARGRGLARRVLGRVLEVARSWEGVTVVELSAGEESLAARGLYESLGFRTWGIQTQGLCIDGECRREVHMELVLG